MTITIGEFAEHIQDEEVRSKFINNCDGGLISMEPGDEMDGLMGCFMFDKTEEGYDYWGDKVKEFDALLNKLRTE